MINNIMRKMRKDDEEGFTLIELLVVVLILGILMAIAIPTFLSLTGGAKTNAAESDLTTAAQDESTYFTSNGSYDASGSAATAPSAAKNIQAGVPNTTGATLPGMASIDGGLNWSIAALTTTSAGTKTVEVVFPGYGTSSALSNTLVLLGTAGADGDNYWIEDNSGTLLYAWTVNTVTTTPAVADFATTNTSWKAMLIASPRPYTS